MKQQLIIITGVSRGLGLALAQQLANEKTQLVGISRSNNSELAAFCHQTGAKYQHISADLARPQGAEQAAKQLQDIITAQTESIPPAHYWLINNAGTVAPMAQSHQLEDPHSIAQALQLNVGSLISLTAAFLASSPTAADRRVLNISSGAGRSAIAGWGVYGATKAAVDHFTQTLALEHPQVRAVALAPGIIDTTMQAEIRDTDKTKFPTLDRFISLHQNQQLSSATLTAEHIARYLANNDFGAKTIDDIRHYF